jgi:hypothetical protein
MFKKEPALVFKVLEEIIRAAIPMALIFSWIHWTEMQTGAVLLFIGVVTGGISMLLTRSQVTSEPEVNALIRTAVAQPTGTKVETVKEIQAEKDAGTKS